MLSMSYNKTRRKDGENMRFTKDIPVGKRIEILRSLKGISQKALGSAIGTSQRRVSDWETAKRYVSTKYRKRMSEYFGVTEDVIFGGKRE